MLITKLCGNILCPYAANCYLCGEKRFVSGEDSLCDDCRKRLHESRIYKDVCPQCLSPVQAGRRCGFCAHGGMKGIDAMYAPFAHKGDARRLVLLLKFEDVDGAAVALGREMADSLPDARFDMLVPVPLHRLRKRERGANQAEVLCRQVSLRTGIPVVNALVRTRYTTQQSRLGKKARADNVRKAFEVCTSISRRRIILVDDVRTTGATARACAFALREAGAESVALLTATVAGHSRLKG